MHRTIQTVVKRLGSSSAVLLQVAAQERCRRPEKALWFVNDALVHGIPIYAVSDWAELAGALFHTLAREDWAGLKSVWDAFTVWHRGDIPGLLKDKINEIEKDGE